MPARHLYIHVPFCARRCSYCDFSIAVRSVTPIDEYIKALRIELPQIASRDDAQRTQLPTQDHAGRSFAGKASRDALETVYLGGGTPSRLGGAGIASVLDAVREHWQLTRAAEITVEANPDDINDIAVAKWIAVGVNRVSLGAQSFNDTALEWMHRTHDSAQIGRAVAILKRGGIDNISLDLIFSLPDHLARSWRDDLQRAIELRPGHLSLYGLTVEPMTPLGRWADRGQIVQGGEEGYEEEFLTAHDMLAGAGFEHYEVSNFGLPGKHSRHNSAYWTGVPYLAAGPSAHSFDGAVRRWNVPAYTEWIRRLEKSDSPLEGEETLTEENRIAEEIYLGLRTTRGIEVHAEDLTRLKAWEAAGWATISQNVLRLTPLGWLRLDSLAADLATHRLPSSAVA
ncbi:MAG TPA: radical SAM family heme chaperone HemW [Gemmatimonadaceae bacterium]|nr:radical SAM family heme chaperone HemW [Gemmatimonadaceae bacterium]